MKKGLGTRIDPLNESHVTGTSRTRSNERLNPVKKSLTFRVPTNKCCQILRVTSVCPGLVPGIRVFPVLLFFIIGARTLSRGTSQNLTKCRNSSQNGYLQRLRSRNLFSKYTTRLLVQRWVNIQPVIIRI
jgi:hypothetical protein